MRKQIATLLTVSMLAGNLAGCGGAAKNVTTGAAVASGAAVQTEALSTAGTEAPVTSAASEVQTTTSASKETTAAASQAEKDVTLSKKEMTFYFGDPETKQDFPVYFKDGVPDIPFLDMETIVDIENKYAQLKQDDKMKFTLSAKDKVMTISREDGTRVDVDFNEGVVTYYNFDDFFRTSYSETPLDLVTSTGFDKDGKPAYISRENVSSFQRQGDPIDVGLKKRGIPLYYQDGKGCVPLQTVSDLLFAQNQISLLYNGNALFMISGASLDAVSDLYYAAPKGKRSKDLAEYSYAELTLALDMFYGLKNSHNIDSFEHLFEQTGLKDQLLSEDPVVADQALKKLCNGYFSDGHSRFTGSSFYAGKDAVDMGNFDDAGLSLKSVYDAMYTYQEARAEYFPDQVPSYQEVGDTAYVTFDHFAFPEGTDYYTEKATPGSADTVGLIQYAHSRIMRKGSPIQNVVIDLSNNGGGDVDAAVYVIGWFLGSSVLNIENTTSTAKASTQYKVDVNGDRVFDENDTVASKNLFCITSPFSFSCGNLVPVTFKKSGKVTILGKNSGGGACSVMSLSSADGSTFHISSNYRISTVVNGSFYDVDNGVEPDYTITKLKDFYNRKALTRYIDSLY